MPGFDGTGPRGMGPMTGEARSACSAPESTSRTEMGFFKNELDSLKAQMMRIEARIECMQNAESKSTERRKL